MAIKIESGTIFDPSCAQHNINIETAKGHLLYKFDFQQEPINQSPL